MQKKCWEIIQCDNESSCPARFSSEDKQCWEVMEEHNSFQCHYGLCEECIVFLSRTSESLLSSREFAEIMRTRLTFPRVC